MEDFHRIHIIIKACESAALMQAVMTESVKYFHRFAIVELGYWKFLLNFTGDGQSMGNFHRFSIVVLFRQFCEVWCRRWSFPLFLPLCGELVWLAWW